MTTSRGLRERKKHATRTALRAAALRLALDRGFDRLRVDDIAEAADVSPRTFNNYYASREQAVVAAVVAQREARIAETMRTRPAGTALSVVIGEAVVAEYTERGDADRDVMLMITNNPALRAAYAKASGTVEGPLRDAIAQRRPDADPMTVRVLAACVATAVRIGLENWLSSAVDGLMVPTGGLSRSLRDALAPLSPAIDAPEVA